MCISSVVPTIRHSEVLLKVSSTIKYLLTIQYFSVKLMERKLSPKVPNLLCFVHMANAALHDSDNTYKSHSSGWSPIVMLQSFLVSQYQHTRKWYCAPICATTEDTVARRGSIRQSLFCAWCIFCSADHQEVCYRLTIHILFCNFGCQGIQFKG